MTAQFLVLTALLATATLEGQATPPAPPSPSSSVPAASMVTVEGCVATSREVHGGSTNLAERIGLDDGFVLTSARVIKGRKPAGTAAAGRGQPMYAIEGLSDEQLKPHLGRRVRIEGSFAKGEGTPGAARPGRLATLTATTVRQLPGDCPIPRVDKD